MKKMIISVCIEGCEEDLHQIKGKMIATASEAMVNCYTAIIDGDEEPPKGCVKIPDFMKGVAR